MSHSAYIVDTAGLSQIPRGVEWHAAQIPGDPTKSLVAIRWDNPNLESEYETRPGVLQLGKPWEPLPPEAGPLLASFSPGPKLAPSGAAAALPAIDTPTAPDTVSSALRKLDWPGARLVR